MLKKPLFSPHIAVKISIVLGALLLGSCAHLSHNKDISLASSENVTLISDTPHIIKGELNNGLTYIVRENKRPQNFAELRLIVKAGSMQEDEAQRGFAHFVEHMAFNGTEDFEKREIIEFVESIGMQFGAHLNAYTGFDETVYKLRIPLDQEGTLETGIQILENWAHKISFETHAIDSERSVVLEEWRSRKGAQERILEKTLPLLLAGTQYPERLPIGIPEIIQYGSHADLVRYYKTWYRADLMSVVAVGDFDGESVQKLIEKYFNKLSVQNNQAHKTPQVLKPLKQPVFAVVADKDLTSSGYYMLWRLPAFEERSIADIRQSTIHNLVLRALNTRFNEAIWKVDAEHVNARVGFNRNHSLGQQFSVSVNNKPGMLAASFQTVLLDLKRAKEHGFTQVELDREKKIILDAYAESLSKQDTFDHAGYLNQYSHYFLNGGALSSLAFKAQAVKEAIASISTLDLQQQLAKWLANDNAVMVATLPVQELEKAPSKEDLLAIYKTVKKTPTSTYTPSEDVTALMQHIPQFGSVVSKSYIEAIDSHVWELSNGIKVHLKQTSFKDNEIRFSAYSEGGFSQYDDASYLKSFGMLSSIEKMGLGKLDTQAFNQYMRNKRFSFSTQINTYSEQAFGHTSREELEAFMQSLHMNFIGPRKDKEVFDWLKSLYKPRIEKRFNNPTNLFYAKIREQISAGDPRAVEFDLERLEQQDLETIFNIRKASFANAADFHYVFVGDIDLLEMEKMLSRYMATLPANEQRDTAQPLGDYDTKGKHHIRLQKGNEPLANVIMSMWGSSAWSQSNSLAFAALKSALQERLLIRLREEIAGVYSVNVSGSFSDWPYQESNLSVSFTCDPERIDELQDEVKQVFAQFMQGNIEQSSIDNFKTRMLTNRQKQLKENGFWQNYLIDRLLPYTFITLDEFEPLVNGLQKDMLIDAAKEHLNRKDKYIAILVPEDE